MIFTAIKSTLAAAAVVSGSANFPAAIQDPVTTQPTAQAPKQNPSYFNPQMSIVGDFVGTLKDNGGEDRRFDFREIEFGFAADADPFLKVEAYIALAKEDGETVVEVEEAFGKYTKLGRGLSAKFGKFAAAVGRVQRNHGDQLNYLDYPLVIRDVLGDEGLRQVGGSLSYLLPGDKFHEFTLEALDAGDEGPVINNSSGSRLSYAGHYRTFFDFSEDLSAQVGASFLSGPSVTKFDASERADVFGTDLAMKWSPGAQGKSAVLEAEALWTKVPGGSSRSFGYFVRGTYEVMPRGFATIGYDSSEIPGSAEKHYGWLANFTFKPTEFHHWRIEFQDIKSSFEARRKSINLQFHWLIGSHPAHKY